MIFTEIRCTEMHLYQAKFMGRLENSGDQVFKSTFQASYVTFSHDLSRACVCVCLSLSLSLSIYIYIYIYIYRVRFKCELIFHCEREDNRERAT